MDFVFNYGSQLNKADIGIKYIGIQHESASHNYGPAFFDHYVLQYVVSGKGTYITNDKVYKLKAGDMFVIFPAQVCQYRACPDDPYKYYSLGIKGESLARYIELCGFTKDNCVKSYQNDAVTEILHQIYLLLETPDNVKCVRAQSLMYKFFEVLLSFISSNKLSSPVHNPTVKKAISYIEHNYIYNISADDIASSVFLNTNYFCSLFKRATGQTPIQYLIDFRIDKACYLLENTDYAITFIGGLVGFADVVNFTIRFKQRKGISPRNYRKNFASN